MGPFLKFWATQITGNQAFPNAKLLGSRVTGKPRMILNMKPNSPVILVLAAAFFSPVATPRASKEEPATPDTLVAKARSQQVWDEQTPPLHI